MLRLAMAVVAAMGVVCAEARADVRYEFINTSYVIAPFRSQIVITDAEYASQAPIYFNLASPGGIVGPGVAPGLVSLSIGLSVFGPDLPFMGTISGSLGPSATTIGVSYRFLGISDEAYAGSTSVVFGSDNNDCSIAGPRTCSATGYYEIPEPASAVILAVGALSLCGFRRKNHSA